MLPVSQDFESFSQFFQYDQPMIYMLWVKILFLIRSLISKFIARKQLLTKDDPKSDDDILKIDPLDKKVCKKASLIDLATKAKVLFSGNLTGVEHEEEFRKESLKFYQIAFKYLLENLPHDNKIIKYTQYLHPKKRFSIRSQYKNFSTSGISNTALAITKVCKISFLICVVVRNAR